MSVRLRLAKIEPKQNTCPYVPLVLILAPNVLRNLHVGDWDAERLRGRWSKGEMVCLDGVPDGVPGVPGGVPGVPDGVPGVPDGG